MRSSHQSLARISRTHVARRVPVVVDVVVVEDHRRRRRWTAASAAPGRPTPRGRASVYSSKSATSRARRHARGRGAARCARAVAGGDLVGVDLVAEQQQRVGPVARAARGHLRGRGRERVDLAAARVIVLASACRADGAAGDAAGAEGQRAAALGARVRITPAAARPRPASAARRRGRRRRAAVPGSRPSIITSA